VGCGHGLPAAPQSVRGSRRSGRVSNTSDGRQQSRAKKTTLLIMLERHRSSRGSRRCRRLGRSPSWSWRRSGFGGPAALRRGFCRRCPPPAVSRPARLARAARPAAAVRGVRSRVHYAPAAELSLALSGQEVLAYEAHCATKPFITCIRLHPDPGALLQVLRYGDLDKSFYALAILHTSQYKHRL
jgi:hypothetical protein